LPAVEGLDGSSVEKRALAGLTVAVSELDHRPDATQGAALRHGAVVDALARANDAVLPVRFGTWFESDDRLGTEIAARAAVLRQALEQVRGCAELGVRVARDGSVRADAPAPTGTAYLRERLAAKQDEERMATLVDARLAALARASARRDPGDQLFNGAYLVESDKVEPFRSAVGTLAAEQPELTIVVTGPWPPYSFAEQA
jgi:gas vesicle protein GvpL/GvpF